MTMTKEQIINRIIEQEIYTNASAMVQQLSEGLTLNSASFAELHSECLFADDYETPAREAIENGTPAFAFSTAEHIGLTLYTKAGAEVADSDMADELEDTDVDLARLLSDIEELDDPAIWADICEYADIEPEMVEALQHWLVSDWLADKLEAVGALVARDVLGFEVWGLTECGQSLTMASDLRKVAELILAND